MNADPVHEDVVRARKLWSKLGLRQEFYPMHLFGSHSAYGRIFLTSGNKIMKVSAWSKNSKREMKVSKAAGNANIGPRVYNTRIWKPNPKNAADMNILTEIARRKGDALAVMTMDRVPRAKTLYNAINNGNIKNFKIIENIVSRMHAAGIHHGNLHGENILVYMNNSGKLRLVPINFGAGKYHRGIKNTASAVRYATQKGGLRGVGTSVVRNNLTWYKRPGREQPVRSNAEMLEALRRYFSARVSNTQRQTSRQSQAPRAASRSASRARQA